MDRPTITADISGIMRRSGPDGIWRWRDMPGDQRFRRRALRQTGVATLVFIVFLGVVAVAVTRLGGGPVNPEAGLLDAVAPVSDAGG
jgi:hypothetical protein